MDVVVVGIHDMVHDCGLESGYSGLFGLLSGMNVRPDFLEMESNDDINVFGFPMRFPGWFGRVEAEEQLT